MNRHDLFKYRDKKKLLTNMANDIEAEREKLYKTTPLYEERYGGSFRDKIADGVIELIEKEEYYKEDMKEMAKELDVTVILIAQRVSTVMDADRILVLDEGEIVGMGAHKELMRTCQVYREIVSSQLSEEELS